MNTRLLKLLRKRVSEETVVIDGNFKYVVLDCYNSDYDIEYIPNIIPEHFEKILDIIELERSPFQVIPLKSIWKFRRFWRDRKAREKEYQEKVQNYKTNNTKFSIKNER